MTKTKYETTLSLPSDREILMTRKFDAPREVVWETITDPELIPQWYGFARDATVVKKMDVRPGGQWQYITRTSGGEVVDFHGTYREVVAPEKLVYSFLFGDMPEGDGFVEITLVEQDGVTELRDRGVFNSKEERDAIIASGMESGARETYERLSELIRARVA
ncbi:MAG: SRPBCC family protein [Chloroflexota bacterium]